MKEYRARSYKARIPPEIPFHIKPEQNPEKTPVGKPFKIRISTRQDSQKPDKIIDPSVDLRYTVGSEIHNCFAAGIFGPLYNYWKSIPMSSFSTVFSAGIMAILRCTKLLMTKNLMRRRTRNYSESRTALAAPVKTTTESFLVWECMQVLGKLNKLKVDVVWISEHQGIPGNEEADRLAKEVPPNQFTAIPFSVGTKKTSRSIWN